MISNTFSIQNEMDFLNGNIIQTTVSNQHHHQQQQLQQQQQLHDNLPLPRKIRKRRTTDDNLLLTRKRTPKLSINDKVKIIYLSKHELKSYNEIGSIFRCTKSTVSGIINNANEILEKASKLTETQSKQTCRVKQNCSYPDVEVSLMHWLNSQNAKGNKPTDKDIRDKAKEECIRIYNRDWKPSTGWLNGFKSRMKRKEISQSSQAPNVDHSSFYGDTNSKIQSKWIDKIKEKTWSVRPESMLRATLQHIESQNAFDHNDTIPDSPDTIHSDNMMFDQFLPPQVFAALSRQSHITPNSIHAALNEDQVPY